MDSDNNTPNYFGSMHTPNMAATHRLVTQGERKRRKVSINGLVTINAKLAGTVVLVTENGDGSYTVTPTM